MPWDSKSFAKHNKSASPHQLTIAARVANAVLKKTGDEGRAVASGNAAINKAKRKRKK